MNCKFSQKINKRNYKRIKKNANNYSKKMKIFINNQNKFNNKKKMIIKSIRINKISFKIFIHNTNN